MARRGQTRRGKARQGAARQGDQWSDTPSHLDRCGGESPDGGEQRLVPARLSTARQGTARPGPVRLGMARHGLVRRGPQWGDFTTSRLGEISMRYEFELKGLSSLLVHADNVLA